MGYIVKCVCVRKKAILRKDDDRFKNHFLFKKAENKLGRELDVVNLVRSIRKMK